MNLTQGALGWEPVGQLQRTKNSPEPKIRQNYHLDIRISPAAGERKNKKNQDRLQ